MTLKLLLSLLFIVWRVTSAEEYSNHYSVSDELASVEFCSHDSFLSTTCSCNVDYGGNACLNRKCRNFGFDGNKGVDGEGNVGVVDRCICPPGFLGRNCEPVKCVQYDQPLTSSAKYEKAISILATYNTPLKENWKSGSIADLVCEYEGYFRKINLNVASPSPFNYADSVDKCKNSIHKYDDFEDVCKDDGDNPIPCEPLKIDHLNTLVQTSPPNSIVFVVTNMALDANDDSFAEQIIATAIARKIQINVVVYNNSLPLLTQDNPSLAYLSKIASATLGTFVLPSIKSANEQYGVVKTLLDIWDSGAGVSTVFTESTPALFVDPTIDYYVAAQTFYGEDLTFNVDPTTVTVANKTDFWKLYKLTATDNPRLEIHGQYDGTAVLVYAVDRIKAYSAFTTSLDGDGVYVDGAFSTSVNGTSYQLVLRLETSTGILQSTDVSSTIGNPATISLGDTFSNLTYCVFNLYIGATCNSIGASVITVLTADRRSVSFPVYCATRSFAESVFNQLEKERVDVAPMMLWESLADDVTCGNEIPSEHFGGRSFVVIAENSRDIDPIKSSADNLFLNTNSFFYQLSGYLDRSLVHYSSFVASLTTGTTATLEEHNDYGTFMTKVITAVSGTSPTTPNPVPTAVPVSDLLIQAINSANRFSDILFVINYNVSTDGNVGQVLEALAVNRARLYVTFVQTYVNITNDVYKYMNDLAVASGGVAVRLNDYNDLHTFFDQYFPLLVANDIVAKSYSENQKAGIALNDVYLTKANYVLLLTNEDLTGDGIVNATVSIDGAEVVALPSIGELQLFTVNPSKAGSYNIPALFSTTGLAQWANIILLADTDSQEFISLSFLDRDNKMRNDVVYGEGKFTPIIYSSVPFDDSSTITITYSDALNPTKQVYSGSIINSTGCAYERYKYTTKYDWVCSVSDGLYHFKIDRVSSTNGTISRTFPIKCLGESSGDCLNGGTQMTDGSCACPIEWNGAHCESPICQNGGTKTPGDTCDCQGMFTGDFCEIINANCTSSPSQPNYRSDLSALYIVADVRALVVSHVSTPLDVTGVPISVILYGDGSDPRMVQSTTNGAHLPEVLGTPSNQATPAPGTADSMYKAINLALDSQLTDRSLIVVLTSNPDDAIDGDLLIRLAANRAEVRVLSTSDPATWSDNYLSLALIGNSIPVSITRPTDLDDYLQSYIAPLFQALQFNKGVPQRVFNVFQTGTIGETKITVSIPADSTFDNAMSMAFVHAYNGRVDVQPETSTLVGSTRIYTFAFDAKQGKEIKLLESQSGQSGYYAIEVISYLKTEYGFNNDTNGQNEGLNVGVSTGQKNTITISSAPDAKLPTSNPANFPSLTIGEILSNGTVNTPTAVAFTRKNGTNCFYKYFAVLDVCSQATLGYQVQLTTRTSTGEARQQQIVLTCHACGGTGSPLNVCACDSGFYGLDCSLPICENGGVRDGTVCRCKVPFYGRLCKDTFLPLPPTATTPSSPTTTPDFTGSSTSAYSTSVAPTGSTLTDSSSFSTAPVLTQSTTPDTKTTTSPPEVRAVAFVIDVLGTDDYAYNETTRSIVEYVRAFNNVHYVMVLANWNNTSPALGFQKFNSYEDLSNAMNIFWTLRKVQVANKEASLTKSLDAILTSYNNKKAALQNAESSNIFYLTQIGLSSDDDPTNSMGDLNMFDKSSLVYSKFSKNADPTVMDSLKKFSDNVVNVRDYYNGVKTMAASTKNNETVVLPDKPDRMCTFGLQNNIVVPIDRSKATSDIQATNQYNFLVKFRQLFNYIDNDDARCGSDTLPDFYNERTAITSFAYYNEVVKTMSYCPSQYNTYLSFNINGTNTSATYSDKLVKTLGKYINKNDCVCNRYSDENTMKVVVWVPRSAAPVSDDFKTYLKLNTPNAYHFVVPFYDVTDKDNDLYYQILVNQNDAQTADYFLMPNAVTNNVDDIIDTLATRICETAGVDPTAIPPELSAMHFPSRHENYYDEFWNN